ncbi:MAG: hypothetical protein ACRCZ0_12450 [Cetobacterium sp.]
MKLINWNLIKKMCEHKAYILRYTTEKDVFTKESIQKEKIIYHDVICSYINQNSSLEQTESSNNIKLGGTLILPPDLEIRVGDKIILTQNSSLEKIIFKAHEIWYYPNSHIEISLICSDVA